MIPERSDQIANHKAMLNRPPRFDPLPYRDRNLVTRAFQPAQGMAWHRNPKRLHARNYRAAVVLAGIVVFRLR